MAQRPPPFATPPGWQPPPWDVSAGVDLPSVPAPAGVEQPDEFATPELASPEDLAWAQANEGDVTVKTPWDEEDIQLEDPNAEPVPWDAADIQLEDPARPQVPWDAADITIEQPPLPPGAEKIGRRPAPPAGAMPPEGLGTADLGLEAPTLPAPGGVEGDLRDPYADDPFADPEPQPGDVTRNFIETATPEELAQYKAARAKREELQKETKLLQAAQDQRRIIEDNEKRRVEATKRAQAVLDDTISRAQAMADSGPFDTWWSSRDTGQKLAGITAAIFGGFLLSKTGGRNAALDHFVQIAEQDAQQKMAALREQRGAATTMLDQAGEDFKNTEATRLAAYEQIVRQIDGEIATLDPEGQAALAMREAKDAVIGQQAKIAEDMRRQAMIEADKMIGRDQEQQRIDEEIRKNAEAERMARVRMAMARAAAAKPVEQKFAPEYFKARGYEIVPPKDVYMTDKEFHDWLENQATSGRISSAKTQEARDLQNLEHQRNVTAKEEAELQLTGVKTKSGKVPLGSTVPEATELRAQKTAIENMGTSLDNIKRVLAMSGPSTEIAQSEAWQKIAANRGLIITDLNVAELGGGVVKEGDIQFAKEALIAGNVDGFKAILRDKLGTNLTAGIDELKRNVVNRYNNKVRGKVRPEFRDDIIGLELPDVKINTPEEDEDMTAALSKGGRGRGSKAEARKMFGDIPGLEEEDAITRNQQLGLQGLAKRVASGDVDVSETAAARLLELAKNDEVANPVVSDAAASILSTLADQGNEEARRAIERARLGTGIYRFADGNRPSASKKAEETVAKVRKSVGLPGKTRKSSVTIDRSGRVGQVSIESDDFADDEGDD